MTLKSCEHCSVYFEEVYRFYEEEVWKPIADRVRRCSRRRCKWWCACCNRWFCWLVAVISWILATITFVIAEVVATILCVGASLYCLVCYFICWAASGFPRHSEDGRRDYYERLDSLHGLEEDPKDGDDFYGCLDNCWARPPKMSVDGDSAGLVQQGHGGTTSNQPRSGQPSLTNDLSVIVTDLSELRPLLGLRHQMLGMPRVRIAIPTLENAEAAALQAALDRFAGQCGCREGQIGLLGATLVIVALATGGRFATYSWTLCCLVTLLLLASGAVIGKAIGVLRARWRVFGYIRGLSRAQHVKTLTRFQHGECSDGPARLRG